jgi:HSP20 family protein
MGLEESLCMVRIVGEREAVMALVRWEPGRAIPSLRRELDRLFEEFEDFVEGGPRLPWGASRGPAMEVADTPDAVVVKALIPGVPKEDVHVDVADQTLTLYGELKEGEKKEHYYRQEIRYGTFERTIPLPVDVQGDQAKAQYKDGVLEITIPKTEKAKVKRIPIQTS